MLHAAYNDAAGVTAQFNLNLLTRINRELGGDFDRRRVPPFRAATIATLARIEMHLESRKAQTVHVPGHAFDFRAGETIHTESSHKFTVESFVAMAGDAGWTVADVFSDARDYFSVYVLRQS